MYTTSLIFHQNSDLKIAITISLYFMKILLLSIDGLGYTWY